MHTRQVKITCVSEARCSGSAVFRSGDYLILQSGGPHPCSAGVAFILHAEIVRSLHSFTPYSARMAMVTLKIVGGLLTIIVVYLPYESTRQDNTEEREAAYEELEAQILEAARHGPVVICGDFNTSIRYRRECERSVIGDHMYTPLTRDQSTVGDGAPAPVAEQVSPNRALLADMCLRTGCLVAQTFLEKPQRKKVTFYQKGAVEPTTGPLDYSKHRELDHTLITAKHRAAVVDVRSRQYLQIGKTTHYIQEVQLRVPIFRRQPRQPSRRLPAAVWQDATLSGLVYAKLLESLQQKLHTNPVHVHSYEPINLRAPPVLRRPEDIGLLLSFYLDGSHEPPSWRNDYAECEAGWSFVVVANQSIYCGQPIERISDTEFIVYRRCGPVTIAPDWPQWVGATKHSNNTGELSAFVEAMIFYLFEAPLECRGCAVSFHFDSLLSGNQTSGDWQIKSSSVNRVLAENSHLLWTALDSDSAPVFGSWVRGHSGNQYNDCADRLAKRGARGAIVGPRGVRWRDVLPAVHRLSELSQRSPVHVMDRSPEELYRWFLEVHQEVLKHVLPYVPKATTRKAYIDMTCLRKVDQREAAKRLGDSERAQILTKELEKECKLAKEAFLLKAVSDLDWKGIKLVKPFQAKQTRVRDRGGTIKSTADRAQVFADHYQNVQWAPADLDPLPARPPLYPPADFRAGDFSSAELRRAKKRVKKGKSPGDDDTSNEFLLFVLSTSLGFSLVLSILNTCKRSASVPEAFHVGVIVALFKGKGKDDSLPENYRPISLLNSLYKLYTIMILARLEEAIGDRISKWQYGFRKGRSVDDAVFSLLRVIELCENLRDLPCYMLLLDWAQAYDRVHTVGSAAPLWDALRRLGVTPEYLSLLENLYANMVFYVKDTLSKSRTAPQRCGLRQGDPLSCFLFVALLTVLMSDAETAWQSDIEQQALLNGNLLKEAIGRDHSTYADDTNLINACLRSLQKMLHAIQREAAYYGLFLNLSKTFLICIGCARNVQRLPRMKDLHGHIVQCVEAERTLGFDLGPRVSTAATIRARARTMLSRMHQFKLVWRSGLTIKQKVERYFSLVVSKGVWGLHLLALKKSDFKHLDYIHVRCLRRILGIKAAFYSRISNAEVLRRAGAECLEAYIRRKQLALLGHLLRRDPDHPDRLVCFEPNTDLQPRMPAGTRRRRGRPRLTWVASILPCFRDFLGINNATIQTLAQNRSRWFLSSERLCRSLQPTSRRAD